MWHIHVALRFPFDFECKPFRDWSLSLLHAILSSGNKKKPHISGVASSGNVPYPYTHSVYHAVTKEITKILLESWRQNN